MTTFWVYYDTVKLNDHFLSIWEQRGNHAEILAMIYQEAAILQALFEDMFTI